MLKSLYDIKIVADYYHFWCVRNPHRLEPEHDLPLLLDQWQLIVANKCNLYVWCRNHACCCILWGTTLPQTSGEYIHVCATSPHRQRSQKLPGWRTQAAPTLFICTYNYNPPSLPYLSVFPFYPLNSWGDISLKDGVMLPNTSSERRDECHW